MLTTIYAATSTSPKTIRSSSLGQCSNPSQLRHPDKTCRTCKIGNNTLIGPSTQVRDETQVNASTIGARCSIGAGSVLRNAYIFDDVEIGPNCTLESCIVGARVRIGEGSQIARGSLVADGVKLGQGTVLRPFERVSRKKQKPVAMIGELAEDESDEGEADSELEEAEQSTHSAASHDPTLDAERANLMYRPALPCAEPGFRL
jgi:carbonic anhydrase/acetyltransferase-like protein (isoleucine patch superfamily)